MRLSSVDKKYVQKQVEAQKTTAAQVDERTWTDIQGGKVQARLMDVEKAKVVLLVKGGTMRLPFDNFTSEDRDYVRQEMTARGEGDKVPKKAPPPRQIAQATPAPDLPSGQPKPPSHKKPKKTKKPAPSSDAPQNTLSPNPEQPPAVVAAAAVQPQAVVESTRLPPADSATASKPQAFAAVTPPSEAKQEQPKQPTPTAVATSNSRCGTKSFAGAHSGHSPAAPCKYRVCSRCKFKLPVTCKAGDDCPNCGAHFSYEQMDESRIPAPATLRSIGAHGGTRLAAGRRCDNNPSCSLVSAAWLSRPAGPVEETLAMKTCAWLLLCVLFAAPLSALARTWTDTQGRSVEGEFDRVVKGRVLINVGGRTIQVPFGHLIPEDQDFVRDQLKAHGLQDQVPAKKKTADTDATNETKPSAKEAAAEETNAEAPAKLGPTRTWTDVKGRTIQARFLGMEGALVRLQCKGKNTSFPFEKFSLADQQYVRGEMVARGEGDKVPAEAPVQAQPVPARRSLHNNAGRRRFIATRGRRDPRRRRSTPANSTPRFHSATPIADCSTGARATAADAQRSVYAAGPAACSECSELRAEHAQQSAGASAGDDHGQNLFQLQTCLA